MDAHPDPELRKTCDNLDVSPKNPLRPSVSRKSMVRPFDFSAVSHRFSSNPSLVLSLFICKPFLDAAIN